MSEYISDLLSEMWEKRLLPIAIVLALAAVAVPLLLRDDGSHSSSSTPSNNTANSALGGVLSALGEEETSDSSVTTLVQSKDLGGTLKSLKRKDPFRQQARAKEAGAGTTSSTGDTGSVTPITSGGSGSGVTEAPKTTDSGQSEQQSSDQSSGFYQRSITIRFGVNDDRLYSDLTALAPLPSSTNPIVTFIGTSTNTPSAVFLVGRGLKQSGEGTCVPSPSSCTYLYLRDEKDRNEHTIYRDESHKYKLKLLDIGAVEADSDVTESAKETAKKSARRMPPRKRLHSKSFPAVLS